jgi:hypothetical protein
VDDHNTTYFTKFENAVILRGFKSPEVAKKKSSNCHISLFGFISYLVYSQIWLNLPYQ